MKDLQKIYYDKGNQFVKDFLTKEITVCEKITGTNLSFMVDSVDGLVFFKNNGARKINLIDRTMMMYYEEPIKYLQNILKNRKDIPNNYIFCCQYFINNRPTFIKYDKLPKNKLFLTHIKNKDTGSIYNSPSILKTWADKLNVSYQKPIYHGTLNSDQINKVLEFLEISQNDKDLLFEDISFSEYMFNALDLNLTKTTLQNDLTKPIDSLIFSDDKVAYKLFDPYTKNLIEFKSVEKPRYERYDINEIILSDLFEFINEKGINPNDVISTHADERYIEIISSIFNDYCSYRGSDIKEMDITRAPFAKGSEFNLNTDFIKNEKTKKLIESNISYGNLFKIMLGSFKKKRIKTGAIFTESLVEDFNRLIEQIEIITLQEVENEFRTFNDFIDVKNVFENSDLEELLIDEKYSYLSEFFINEKLKMQHTEQGNKPVNVFLGKFQPFTKGHVKVFEKLHKENGLPVVLLTVPSKKKTDKKPFSFETQNAMFTKLKSQYPFIEAMYTVSNAAVNNIFDTIRPVYEPMLWGYGSDRKKDYERMINNPQYRKDMNVDPQFKGFEIKRTDEDISATKVRHALGLNDINEYKKLTPKSLHDMYTILQDEMEIKESIKVKGTPLSPGELIKPNSQTQEPRLSILKEMIINEEEFLTKEGKKFIVTDKDSALNEIETFNEKEPRAINLIGRYSDTSDEIEITTSKLLKTEKFGGMTGGVRGGASLTALTESAQCYYCAAVSVAGKKLKPEEFTPELLEEGSRFVRATKTVKQVIRHLDESWVKSCIDIANDLFKKGYIKQNQIYHRGSKKVDKIYSIAKQAGKKSGINVNSDKWNPADIWIVTGQYNVNQLDKTSIEALNQNLLDLFDEGIIIPISLKKVASKPKIEIKNKDREIKNYRPIGYDLYDGAKSTFESTNKVILKYNGGDIEGRTFNYMSNWAFEVRDKNAAGGKCGLTAVQSIFNFHHFTTPDVNYPDLRKKVIELDESLINEMYQMYIKFNDKSKYTFEEFEKILYDKHSTKKGQNWIFSKYIGMTVFLAFLNAENVENEIVNDIIMYAMSSSSFSSIHLKVY